MDYEKAYKEALERTKEAYEICNIAEQRNVLEEIFPELKKSEDEMIRTYLIKETKVASDIKEEFKTKVLAWLEKQKEQKPDCRYGCPFTDEQLKTTDFWKEYLKESIIAGGKPTKQDIDFLLPTARKLFSLAMKEACTICKDFSNGYEKGLENGKQLAEWSEEDNRMLKSLIDYFEGRKMHDEYTVGEIASWLKSLRPRPFAELKPYYIEGRGIFIPIINKVLDMGNLSNEPMTWDNAMKLAKEKGKELFSLKESRIITYFYSEINELLSEHGGQKLESKNYWTSEVDEEFVWFVYLDTGNAYSDRYRNDYFCVRAVSAL